MGGRSGGAPGPQDTCAPLGHTGAARRGGAWPAGMIGSSGKGAPSPLCVFGCDVGLTAAPCPALRAPVLARRYLEAPYLVGGKKFDLRIYALVTSYNPLRIFLHR